jgi:hypothetical protein
MPGFSVPFGGCVGAREADGVDLSESAAAESVTFFLSPADCAGTGVEGRGECAAPFLDTTFAGAHRCSRFLRLAWYLKRFIVN